MYQVWTLEEFGDTWKLTECGDLVAVKEAILAATKAGREVKVSLPLGFSVDVKIEEAPAPVPPIEEKPLTDRQKREREAAESETQES